MVETKRDLFETFDRKSTPEDVEHAKKVLKGLRDDCEMCRNLKTCGAITLSQNVSSAFCRNCEWHAARQNYEHFLDTGTFIAGYPV